MKDKELLQIMQALPEEYLDEAVHYQLLAASLAPAALQQQNGKGKRIRSPKKASVLKFAVPGIATAAAAAVAVTVGISRMNMQQPDTIPVNSVGAEVTEITPAQTETTAASASTGETRVTSGSSKTSGTEKSSKTTKTTAVSETAQTTSGTSRSQEAQVTTSQQPQTTARTTQTSARTTVTTIRTTQTDPFTTVTHRSTVSTVTSGPTQLTQTTTTASSSTAQIGFLLGDVDLNGTVDAEDANLLLREYLTVVVEGGDSLLNAEQMQRGDVVENNPYYPFGKYPVEKSLKNKPIIETDYPITQTDAWVVLSYVQERKLGRKDALGTLEEYIEATDPASWRGSYRYQFVYVPEDFAEENFPVDSFGSMPMTIYADGQPLSFIGYEIRFYGVKLIECCYYFEDGGSEYEAWFIHQPDLVMTAEAAEAWCAQNPDTRSIGGVNVPIAEKEQSVSGFRDYTLLIANRKVDVRVPEDTGESAENDVLTAIYDLYTSMYQS